MHITMMIRHGMLTVLLCAFSFGAVSSGVGHDHKPESSVAAELPPAGMTMQQVTAIFGEPAEQLPSMGKPPITVWRYADFNVYFERQMVLHSVRFVPFVRPIQIIID